MHDMKYTDDLLSGLISSKEKEGAAEEDVVNGGSGSNGGSNAIDITNVEDPEFSYDGYQIVRGEYFAHINEPSVTICDCKISINNACLKRAPSVTYVQALINQDTRKFVIRPCNEDERDSFCWCTSRRKPRYITCKGFYVMLIRLLGWNPDYRYKLLGKMIRSNNETLFVFDLNSPEIYRRNIVTDATGKTKVRSSRAPLYPEGWENQFGMSVAEHQKAVQINIFDGYAVFGIKDTSKHQLKEEAEQ